jgi:hypothetical protein
MNVTGWAPTMPMQSMPVIYTPQSNIINNIIIVLIIGIVVYFIYHYIKRSSDKVILEPDFNAQLTDTVPVPEPAKESFAVSDETRLINNWKVYVTPTCPFCVRQRLVLSEHFPNFNNFEPPGQNINGVPTWENLMTKKQIPGFKDYNGLLNMINNE